MPSYDGRVMCLEFAMSASNRESHVDAAQNIVGVGLAVEEGLGFVVTLKNKISLYSLNECGIIKFYNFRSSHEYVNK